MLRHYNMSILNKILIAVTLVFISISIAGISYSQDTQILIFSLGIILIGIPHGAVDHLIHSSPNNNSPRKNLRSFTRHVLKLIMVYGVVWLISPAAGLLIFLLLSYYHFGQTELSELKLSKYVLVNRSIYCSWGLVIVNSLLYFKAAESYGLIESLISHVGVSEKAFTAFCMGTTISAYLYFTLATLIYLTRKDIRLFFIKQLNIGVLILLFASTNLLVSFTIFFSLWHSLKSIKLEINNLQIQGISLTIKDFFKQAIPLSIISYLGILVLLVLNNYLGSSVPTLTVFFIVLSTITLPHVFTIDQLLSRKNIQ